MSLRLLDLIKAYSELLARSAYAQVIASIGVVWKQERESIYRCTCN